MTVRELLNEFNMTEGNDCTDYRVVVDIGTAPFLNFDELFVVYDHGTKTAYINRRRTVTVLNPNLEWGKTP